MASTTVKSVWSKAVLFGAIPIKVIITFPYKRFLKKFPYLNAQTQLEQMSI